MSTIKVNVKWGKQKFEGVELDTSAPVELFKAQLFALTQVPPERQKIMGVKGGSLKDDADMSTLGIKAGQNLMLMGSADVLAAAPETPTVFAEDLPKESVDAMLTDNPGGLTNLGNTCYLNSSLQCLKAIPELTTSLKAFEQGQPGGDDTMVVGMREIMEDLEKSNAAQEVRPFKFVSTFRTAFPLFAQRTDDGRGFVQQDAEECWSTLLTALSQKMSLSLDPSVPTNLPAGESALLPRMQALRRNVGDMLFGIEMESSYACLEGDGIEPGEIKRESERKISCYISEKTAHLYTAIEVNLDQIIEKNSPLLGREAQYSKKSKLARLPPVLAVQFVRFAFRKDTNKRAKILRTVSFPPVLDVRNMCTTELQASIAAHCTTLEEERDAKAGIAQAGDKRGADEAAAKPATDAAKPAAAAGGSSDATPMDVSDAAPTAKMTPEELAKASEFSLGAECGDNRTGRYELFAVITHQGRTAEGGHYVGWVKKDSKKWLVFDDETVAEFDADRVKELYGGGDFHMAYMCFYRKMDGLTVDEQPEFKPKTIATKAFSMEGASGKSAN